MTRRAKTVLRACAAVVITAWCAALGARILSTYLEYYGDGPPYYGRTTNMDKWQSPAADLATSCGALLLSLVALVYVVSRWRKTETNAPGQH